jgi:hypothetical protein
MYNVSNVEEFLAEQKVTPEVTEGIRSRMAKLSEHGVFLSSPLVLMEIFKDKKLVLAFEKVWNAEIIRDERLFKAEKRSKTPWGKH